MGREKESRRTTVPTLSRDQGRDRNFFPLLHSGTKQHQVIEMNNGLNYSPQWYRAFRSKATVSDVDEQSPDCKYEGQIRESLGINGFLGVSRRKIAFTKQSVDDVHASQMATTTDRKAVYEKNLCLEQRFSSWIYFFVPFASS